ncbi:MAG TPA: DMT family transporter [Solirubrobacterales bacterium]|nr:DMT family transporter [Solirubrobacterales bacterium]
MDRGLAVILTAAVGGLIAMQPAINSGLSRETGSLPAALVSFIVGTIALAVIVGLSGQLGNVRFAFDAAPVYLLGGLLGALYVTMALIAVREIGAGGVAAATITGQLTFSLIIDRLGILGLRETEITVDRLLGVALLLAGTWLIVR